MSAISLSRLPIASPALFLGGVLWVAAFWLPVFETPERTISGYWVFVTGWMGFVVFQFAWFANLLMLMAVIMMYTAPLRATLLAAVGLLVATQAFWFDVLPGSTSSTPITAQGLGFWFWYGSIFLLGLGVVFGSDEFAADATAQKAAMPKEAATDGTWTPSHSTVQAGSVAPSSISDQAESSVRAESVVPDAGEAKSSARFQPAVQKAAPVESQGRTEPVIESDHSALINEQAHPWGQDR